MLKTVVVAAAVVVVAVVAVAVVVTGTTKCSYEGRYKLPTI